MKILFCQPIFMPDDTLYEKNMNSIKSLHYILKNKSSDYMVTFKISGWVKKQEYWDRLIKLLENQNFEISYERLEHNYGKAYVINKIIRESEKHDYIFTCDSDIIFLDNQNYLVRLVECIERNKKDERGIVALNLKEANPHILNFFNTKIEYEGVVQKEVIKFNNMNPGGIGGGCLFIDSDSWKKINGYRIYGIYAGDDSYLFSDMVNNKKKNCMLETIYAVHPREYNNKYISWKRDVIDNTGIKDKKYLENLSEELNNVLW